MQKAQLADENIQLAKQIQKMIEKKNSILKTILALKEESQISQQQILQTQQSIKSLQIKNEHENLIITLEAEYLAKSKKLKVINKQTSLIRHLLDHQDVIQDVKALHETLQELQNQIKIHSEITTLQNNTISEKDQLREDQIQQQKDIQAFIFKCKQEKQANRYKMLKQLNRVSYKEAIRFWQ
ncbi:hypothetical protein SS50377_27299 [Spironucleus salmonicida]|uniref:Uncharacterized protein n=1 Tax=Spironucleus salmonicida TaxID=348837 RepID=V6LTT5_9EUKA|nr:hypothetical protein SS50377_27299 [Spironucleus salmonicida]|eukprot:EST48010.1 Hypothetical protein SS50377_11871 [Spironucleus salmonicida]